MNNNNINNLNIKMIWLILTILTIPFLYSSCKTVKPQQIPIYITDTLYNTKTNTEYIKDSIFINQYQKNDTIYIDKYHYKYRDINKTDTLFKYQHVDKPIFIDKISYTHYPYEKYLWLTTILSFIYIILKIYNKFKH